MPKAQEELISAVSVLEDFAEAIEGRIAYLEEHTPLDRHFIRLQQTKLAVVRQILHRERTLAAKVS